MATGLIVVGILATVALLIWDTCGPGPGSLHIVLRNCASLGWTRLY